MAVKRWEEREWIGKWCNEFSFVLRACKLYLTNRELFTRVRHDSHNGTPAQVSIWWFVPVMWLQLASHLNSLNKQEWLKSGTLTCARLSAFHIDTQKDIHPPKFCNKCYAIYSCITKPKTLQMSAGAIWLVQHTISIPARLCAIKKILSQFLHLSP